MSYWIDKVKTLHEWAHQNDGYQLRFRDGRLLAEIKSVEASIGFEFPSAVRAFYQEVDGFGVQHSSSEKISWFVVPIDRIATVTKKARDWFRETHPNEAERFFAFIDWNCGEYTGYLVRQRGDHPTLVTFSHEEYEFDSNQNSDDFFETSYDHFEEIFDTDSNCKQ